MPPYRPAEERFWEKVNKHGPKVIDKQTLKLWPELKGTRCWKWTAAKDSCGYGYFGLYGGIIVKAHRFSYELFYDKKLKKQGCHKCDNPGCPNPEHIFDGSQRKNNRDRKRKGRNACRKGELNWKAVTNNRDVIKIRQLYDTGEYTQKELGLTFKISQPQISAIIRQASWAHI